MTLPSGEMSKQVIPILVWQEDLILRKTFQGGIAPCGCSAAFALSRISGSTHAPKALLYALAFLLFLLFPSYFTPTCFVRRNILVTSAEHCFRYSHTTD